MGRAARKKILPLVLFSSSYVPCDSPAVTRSSSSVVLEWLPPSFLPLFFSPSSATPSSGPTLCCRIDGRPATRTTAGDVLLLLGRRTSSSSPAMTLGFSCKYDVFPTITTRPPSSSCAKQNVSLCLLSSVKLWVGAGPRCLLPMPPAVLPLVHTLASSSRTTTLLLFITTTLYSRGRLRRRARLRSRGGVRRGRFRCARARWRRRSRCAPRPRLWRARRRRRGGRARRRPPARSWSS
mmetsp:Transcript_12353/g.37294  ORF Transcript_12353/g.37294 Transcript_12353/m.37294 type:complete len:237 (+) Transcript_12353:1621-2331(+)